jgi:sucrose 6(F)-phosphate phosphorylase
VPFKNKVQLITYPDSLGGDLKSLSYVLKNHLKDVCEGGIHILPPFPSSGDRGFAPLTYLEIDHLFGTWDDIKSLGEDFDIMLDLMVNHISRQSAWFQNFLKNGRNSEYEDLFITADKIWSDGKPRQEDLDKIFLRREKPFSLYTTGKNEKPEIIWTTFGKQDPSEQIDLDINSETTKKLLSDFIKNFKNQNIKAVRLDAVGYVIKKTGTSCFFVEPEIYKFLDWIYDLADSLGIEMLPEVHSEFAIQYKLAERGFWIYDFILPFMILETLITRLSSRLKEYLKQRPHRQITMLDCHDGIPVKPDLNGLVDTEDARKIVDLCMQRGANLSRVISGTHKDKSGFDVHQIRGSYFSLLDCNRDAYIAARAIQFFTPGIPQVYYVGLLAGENDNERVKNTGEGREINRHNFTIKEIEEAIEKDAVKRLIKLIRFRNSYPAFNGSFALEETDNNHIVMNWENGEDFCKLEIDLMNYLAVITFREESGSIVKFNA